MTDKSQVNVIHSHTFEACLSCNFNLLKCIKYVHCLLIPMLITRSLSKKLGFKT